MDACCAVESDECSADVLFRWQHMGSQSVAVSGSWCRWSEKATPLSAEGDVFGRGRLFSGTVRLPFGRYLFRFLVDGAWCHDPQLTSERDDKTGELCNVVDVSPDSPFRLQLPAKAEVDNSVEATDYMNSLREYGLRTPSPRRSSLPLSSSKHKTNVFAFSSSSSSAPAPAPAPGVSSGVAVLSSSWPRLSSPSRLPLPPPEGSSSSSSSSSLSSPLPLSLSLPEAPSPGSSVTAAAAAAYAAPVLTADSNPLSSTGSGAPVVVSSGVIDVQGGPERAPPVDGEGGEKGLEEVQCNGNVSGGAVGGLTASGQGLGSDPQEPLSATGGSGNSGDGGGGLQPCDGEADVVAVGGGSGSGAGGRVVGGAGALPLELAREVWKKVAPVASVTYRRREASVAAVGACLVTSSSVRKHGKLFVAMVGLPARGKSFVARSIARHLKWMGLKCQIFSVGKHRQKEVGMFKPATYFDPGGESESARKRLAGEVLDEALNALREDIDIAIYDASNITKERRQWLAGEVAASGLHVRVFFIESICNDAELVRGNILEVRQCSPEYVEQAADEAELDFRGRIARYEQIYQPLEADEGYGFIKLFDVGSQMVTNLISGYIPGRITLLCLNLHLTPRPIWMSRHGESEYNMQGRIGGDAPLTSAGKVYASKLAEFMNKLYPPSRGGDGDDGDDELVVWTSTMLRTGQTVAPMTFDREVIKWSQLAEINAGLMDSLTYEYVASEMPQEYEARQNDKLRYRYPGGESYQDLFARLEPVLFEMLRQRSPLLVVGHQAILRVLYGYLTGKQPGECPTLHMPLHTAIKLTPKAYECEEEWHRPLEECAEPVVDVKHPTSDIHSA